jgi:hypothetical protein
MKKPYVAAVLMGLLTLLPASFVGWYAAQVAINGPTFWTMLADKPCKHPFVDIAEPPAVLTISESTELRLLVNRFGRPTFRPPGWKIPKDAKGCNAEITIDAPAFELSEARRSIHLPAVDENYSVSWVLSPKKVGRQTIVITSGLDKLKVSITVMSDLGFTARQGAIFATLLTALGAIATLASIYFGLRKQDKAV